MEYLREYLEKYGDVSFRDKPFNEIDSLIFSQLIYNDFGDIVRPEERIFLGDAAEEFCEKYPEEKIDTLLDVAKRAAQLLTMVAKKRRFSGTVLCNYIDNINDALDKQISAVNFITADGAVTVAFRGTDATVAGFKESAMLAYMFPVPAQIEALHYFQETAMLHRGAVRLCGHSKGGNLAIFAAVNCSNSLKKKIDTVYAFDAPGFPEWFFERYDYRQIRDCLHIVNPSNSIVGRALTMEKEPEIVISMAKHGRQHNVATWKIQDDAFERAEKYTEDSDKLGAYLNELVAYIGDKDLEVFYDALEQTANQMGISDFYDLKEVDTNLLFIIIDSIQTLNPEQKKRFRALVVKVMSDAAKDYVSGAATWAKSYVKNISQKLPLEKIPFEKLPFVGKSKDEKSEYNDETDGD